MNMNLPGKNAGTFVFGPKYFREFVNDGGEMLKIKLEGEWRNKETGEKE